MAAESDMLVCVAGMEVLMEAVDAMYLVDTSVVEETTRSFFAVTLGTSYTKARRFLRRGLHTTMSSSCVCLIQQKPSLL